jgi:AraC-like DNA-binding protein
MLEYREIAPSPALASTVECFWTMRQDGEASVHRVLPDGCTDILLTCSDGAATLDAVGPMTTYRDHPVGGGRMFGVRFRPGRGRRALAVPADRIVDATVPLEDLWGARARRLLERLANTERDEERARRIEEMLPRDGAGPVERALGFLERSGGSVSVDDLAREAGLSPRQFRRVCLEATGLTPKFLARVLRFRNAAARVGAGEPAIDLALDCGYYDQAHLIRDFRELAGRTPGKWGLSSVSRETAS